MADFSPFIYIVLGLIWLISSAAKNAERKKKAVSKPSDSPKPEESEDKKQKTVEEMLRDILEKNQKKKPAAVPVPRPVAASQPAVKKKVQQKIIQPEPADPESILFLKSHEEGHRLTRDVQTPDKKRTVQAKFLAGGFHFDPKLAVIYSEIMKPKFGE